MLEEVVIKQSKEKNWLSSDNAQRWWVVIVANGFLEWIPVNGIYV